LQQARDNLQSEARSRMWPLISDVAFALQPLVRATVQSVFNEHLPQRAFFNPMRMAREAQPQPFTVQRLSTRIPYTNPDVVATRLRDATAEGYFEEAAGGHYTLTAKGERVVDVVNDAFYQALGAIDVMPAERIERLNELLHALVEAALQSDLPSKACIRQTFDTAQPRDYAPLARLDLNVDDLNAFRDDAHHSAWSAASAGGAHDVPGRDRETMALVWRGEATTSAEIAQKCAFRGYDEADYAASLQALAGRGWLQADAHGTYTVTPEGDALRRKIEQATDDIFYATWDETLSGQQQNELRTLLIELKRHLNAAEKSQQEVAALV